VVHCERRVQVYELVIRVCMYELADGAVGEFDTFEPVELRQLGGCRRLGLELHAACATRGQPAALHYQLVRRVVSGARLLAVR